MKKLLSLFTACFIWLQITAQTPSDSIGVYAVYNNIATPIEVINYNSTKISQGFMSAKAKLEFAGKSSRHHFKNQAKLRVYFGQPAPHELAKLYMFTPQYSIKDFGIGRFEVKKNSRLLTTGSYSAFNGGKGGAEHSKDIKCETIELRPGVYEITITGDSGEYCLMHTFRGGAGFGGVFDFSIQ